MARREAAEAVLEDLVVRLGANAVVRQLEGPGVLGGGQGLAAINQVGPRFADSVLQRAWVRSAVRDMRLFGQRLPVMVKAAPTASMRPKTPQFSSHSLSFMRYGPFIFLRPPERDWVLLCEKTPSMTRV